MTKWSLKGNNSFKDLIDNNNFATYLKIAV